MCERGFARASDIKPSARLPCSQADYDSSRSPTSGFIRQTELQWACEQEGGSRTEGICIVKEERGVLVLHKSSAAVRAREAITLSYLMSPQMSGDQGPC